MRVLETSRMFDAGRRTLPEFHVVGSTIQSPVTLNVENATLDQVRKVVGNMLIALEDTQYLEAVELSASTSSPPASDSCCPAPSIFSLGAVGDGTTDDTEAFRAAASIGGAWTLPTNAVFRLTAPVTINNAVTFHGQGVAPYTDLNESVANVRGPGSWIHLDHTGIGFLIDGTSGTSDSVSNVVFSACGTFRTQPTPGVGAFTPTDHSWDFDCYDVDIQFRNFCALNPTRFVKADLARGGRLRMDNVVGQPLLKGIEIDDAYDKVVIDCRFWPYWSLNDNVRAYTLANLISLHTYRIDGLNLLKFFTIFHYRGWLVDQSAAGTLNYAHGDWVYLDNGTEGLIFSASTDSPTVYINDLLIYGRAANSASYGLGLAGTNARLRVSNLTLDDFGNWGAYIGGTNNLVIPAQLRLKNWGHSGAGVQGFVVDGSGNILRILSPPEEINLGGRPFSAAVSGGLVQYTYVPAGGTSGQVLTKASGADFDTQWTTASGGVSDGDKGDITVSSSGSVWTIDNQAVTYAKIQDVTDARLLGRSAGGAGPPQELTVGSGLSLLSGVLSTANDWQERRLIADETKANDTTVQAWFASAAGVPLAANSTYEFEGVLISTNGTTSHGLNLQFDAIAGASIAWQSIGSKAVNNAQATALRFGRSTTFNTNRLATTASTVAGNIIRVWGTIITTTAGTFTPRVAQSAASGSFTINAGTFMRVRLRGANTFTNSGQWV
jgi:hypothetical protein